MSFKCWGLLIETKKSILNIFDLELLLFIDYIPETKVYKEGRLTYITGTSKQNTTSYIPIGLLCD